jgi:hypothetical protein
MIKKFYPILGLLAVVLTFQCANAQPFTNLWKKQANGTDYTWFTGVVGSAQANNTASLDYNPVTDKLLVSCRNNSINIINPATGAADGTMNVTGMGAEAFKFNKIRVDANGVIYGISLVIGAGTCKIYRWASQTSAPVECASFAVTERTGDAFGLSGTGNNTILYASGAGTTSNAINIYMLTTANGTNFTVESKINVASANAQWANRTVEPVTNSVTSDLWIKMGGNAARRIAVGANNAGVRTGTVAFTTTDGTGSGQVSNGFGGMRLLTNAIGRKFLAFSGGNNSYAGTKMKMINIDNEPALVDFGVDSSRATAEYTPNTNGTGDVCFKNNTNGSYTVFFLSTNNAIAATQSTNDLLPVVLSQFAATLRSKSSVLLDWSTTAEQNNQGFSIEKSLNGIDFSGIAFVGSKAPNGNSSGALLYRFEDPKALPGTSYYRLRQINKDGKASLSKIETVQNTVPLAPLSAWLVGNPVKSQLSLLIKSSGPKTVALSVVNAAGHVMDTRVVALAQGNNNLSFNTNQYSKGVLWVTIANTGDAAERVTIKALKD